MPPLYERLTAGGFDKIIDSVKENLKLNLIGKGRIKKEMKGIKGLIIVKNKKNRGL